MTLEYIQPLGRLAGQNALAIPFCPGMRYIPGNPLLRSNRGQGTIDDTDQVPDASRISPVRIDDSHSDAAFIDVEGRIDANCVEAGSLMSPTHAVECEATDGTICVRLVKKSEVADRDFALRWQEKVSLTVQSRAWTCRKGEECFALLEIRAPETLPDAEQSPQDVYFLVDRSGSMEGEKWSKAIEAVHSFINVLGPNDRVMLTLFESCHVDFAEKPLSPNELRQDFNFQRLADMGADGGTELAPALRHALELAASHSQGRRCNLVLITDAEVGNESEIVEIMKSSPGLPVHCFGIDTALNDALLRDLARHQGGTFHWLSPGDDIAAAVTQLGRTLRQPVLLDLKLNAGWELAETRLPDLYAGQVHFASARTGGRDRAFGLTGTDSAGRNVTLEIEHKEVTDDGAYLRWCKERLQRLLAEFEDADAINLSKQSNLICALTAFIAWDEQEQVAVATHGLTQPAMEPLAALVEEQCAFETVRCKGVRRALAEDDTRMCLLSLQVQDQSLPFAGREHLLNELERLCEQAGHPDWLAHCLPIVEWVYAAKTPDERGGRECLLLELIDELRRDAEQLQQFRYRVAIFVSDLSDVWRQAEPPLMRFCRGEPAQSPEERDEMIVRLQEARHLFEAEQSVGAIRQAVQLEKTMLERLSLFFEAHPSTA